METLSRPPEFTLEGSSPHRRTTDGIWEKLNSLRLDMKDIKYRLQKHTSSRGRHTPDSSPSGSTQDLGPSPSPQRSARSVPSSSQTHSKLPSTSSRGTPSRSPASRSSPSTGVRKHSSAPTMTSSSSRTAGRREDPSTPLRQSRRAAPAPSSAPAKSEPRKSFGRLTEENLANFAVDSTPPPKRGPRSRLSVCTEMGTSATSSRLYDPKYVQKRRERLEEMKRQRELEECSFKPVIKEPPTGGRRIRRSDSIESMESTFTVRTDMSLASSRLYQADYLKRREERLARMRQERELMECTFKPQINKYKTSKASASPPASSRSSKYSKAA